MYRVVYQDGDAPRSLDFEKGEVVIGRSPDCQICPKDFGISRRHAKLVADEDGVRLVDLQSKNGCQINGVAVLEAPLRDGDRIRLGQFELTFSTTLAGRVVLDEAEPGDEVGTIVRSVGDISRMLSGAAPAAKDARPEQKVPDVAEIQNANKILRVLTRVAETLIAVRPVADVLQQVMEIVFENVPADRGFLMLVEEGSSELVPAVVKHRNPRRGDEGITISRQIANKVIAEKVAILTSDASIDSRFSGGDSIAIHGIRSAICAPLWDGAHVIGIVFVDSMSLARPFDEHDLNLLTALASYAGLAVERARLGQKILAEEKKRDRLGRFLSPQVASRVLATSDQDGGALGQPEEREVSVLFSDICGFTSMSETMSPSKVAVLLSDYLGRMTEAIFAEEGTLDKYIGDAIMAVFGAPLDMPDHAARAIRSALAMRERLEEFNAERREGPALRIRIGINSGRVVACEIGGQNKREYTVLGDTVNIASRLESSVAQPMMIVVGENTHAAVQGLFEMRPLGSATLKGKEIQVVAYEVVRELGAKDSVPPPTMSVA